MATAKKSTNNTTAKRTAKSAADLKLEIEKTQKKLADLQTRAYAEELHELIGKTGVVDTYKSIKAAASGVADTVILAAIAKAVGVARITVTQASITKRATKPRKKAGEK